MARNGGLVSNSGDQPNEWRTFEMYGTGHPMPANPGEYVETFQMDGGALVWHVFDATNAT